LEKSNDWNTPKNKEILTQRSNRFIISISPVSQNVRKEERSMGGYAGKVLHVDLTSGSIDDFSITQELFRRFIGGSGLGAALFLDRFDPEVEPLSPENPQPPLGETLAPN